jgi:hypothetical protein
MRNLARSCVDKQIVIAGAAISRSPPPWFEHLATAARPTACGLERDCRFDAVVWLGRTIMGKGITDVMRQVGADPRKSMEAEVARLTKLVHILWKEVEKLEGIVHVIPEGLKIKSGRSEILVLKNGGIVLNGARIYLETPGKKELMY